MDLKQLGKLHHSLGEAAGQQRHHCQCGVRGRWLVTHCKDLWGMMLFQFGIKKCLDFESLLQGLLIFHVTDIR